MMLSSRNRSPFTETQWQELEHQALIFKYMISGIPIPPDLIYTVKKSLMDSSPSANLYSHQPAGGWGCFQVGFGRRADPEPGRCRRTDGKKWRCSKEAYPDSKYCERHMHRGKNRSRKPVEVITTPNTSNTTSSTTSSAYSLLSLSSSSPSSLASDQTHPYHNTTTPLYPFPYHPHSSSSSSRPPTSVLSSQNNTSHEMLLDSGSYSQADKDYRYFNGMRESLDERAFFPEASGTLRSLPESYTPLTISSSSGYSSQFQSLGGADYPKQQQQQKEQHCFVLGTDFKSTRPIKSERDQYTDDEAQKQMHHFFSENGHKKIKTLGLILKMTHQHIHHSPLPNSQCHSQCPHIMIYLHTTPDYIMMVEG